MGEFSKIIKSKRTELNLTGIQLIEKMDGKISKSYLSLIEAHGEIPAKQVMIDMAKALGIDYHVLISAAKIDRLEKTRQALDRCYE